MPKQTKQVLTDCIIPGNCFPVHCMGFTPFNAFPGGKCHLLSTYFPLSFFPGKGIRFPVSVRQALTSLNLFDRRMTDARGHSHLLRFMPKQNAVITFDFSIAEATGWSLAVTPAFFPKDVCFSLLIPPKRGEQTESNFGFIFLLQAAMFFNCMHRTTQGKSFRILFVLQTPKALWEYNQPFPSFPGLCGCSMKALEVKMILFCNRVIGRSGFQRTNRHFQNTARWVYA